jgi:hypothetical protein
LNFFSTKDEKNFFIFSLLCDPPMVSSRQRTNPEPSFQLLKYKWADEQPGSRPAGRFGRQKDRRMDRWTDRMDRQMERYMDGWKRKTDRQRHRWTYRQARAQMDGWTNGQTDSQSDSWIPGKSVRLTDKQNITFSS